MPKIHLIKGHGNVLKPADEGAEQYLSKVGFSREVVCNVRLPRNPMFHRKFFALLRLVFENQELYSDFDQFRNEVVMRAGYFEEHTHLTGKVSYVAKSLAYESMDEAEFEALYEQVIVVLLAHFMKGMERTQLEEAVLDYVTDYAS